MRIVITHTDLRLYWPARLKALANILTEKGHNLQIIEIAGKGSPYSFANSPGGEGELNWICLFPEEEMEDIPSHLASKSLWEKLEEIEPDVVFAGAIAFPSGATATRWCRVRNKKTVIFDNARPEDVPRSFIVNYIKRRIYRNVDAILIPAESHADAFKFWGVPQEKMFYGLNVVNNHYFAGQVNSFCKKKKELQEELGLNKPFLLGVGRLVPKKNWDKVLLAYAEFRNKLGNKAPQLVIIGDGPYKERIEKIFKEESIKDIQLLPFVSQETLCKYYALASALILASGYGETWGLVVNEAMAAGLPVLVSKECGCSATLVQHGKNGFVFPAEDSGAIAHFLSKFFSLSFQEQQTMGEYSKYIIKDWSLDRFSKGALEAFNYTQKQPDHLPSLIDAFILRVWKGRYRPT